jgi:hypothetical protein
VVIIEDCGIHFIVYTINGKGLMRSKTFKHSIRTGHPTVSIFGDIFEDILECNCHTVTLHNINEMQIHTSVFNIVVNIYIFFEVHLLCFIRPSKTLVKYDNVVQKS